MADALYQLTIKQLPADEQPRERLKQHGPDVLKLVELLAIILNTGYKSESVIELAGRILRDYGSKAITSQRDVTQVMASLALPEVKACQLVALFEIGRRVFEEDKGRLPSIRGPEDVWNFANEMRTLRKEQFRGLYLNSRNRLIHDEVISLGTLTTSLVHPREVLRPAIEYAAAGIILVHNHPSGDPEPSSEDVEVTRQMVGSGRVLGIDILDHVIVAEDGWVSLQQRGDLDN